MDKLIAVIVRTGRVPSEDIAKQIDSYLQDHEKALAINRVREIWDRYRSSLSGDDDHLANLLLTTFHDCKKYVSVGDVSSAAWLLRVLGKSSDADVMIDEQVQFWSERGESFRELRENRFGDTDPYLLGKLQHQDTKGQHTSASEVFEFFVKSMDGRNPEVEAALLSLTRSDWLTFLQDIEHVHLMSVLKRVRDVYAYLKTKSSSENSPVAWHFSPLDVALRALKYKSKANIQLVRSLFAARQATH